MDVLTQKQIEMLKQKLINMREEIVCMLADSLESSQPVGLDQPIGRLSRMDALQQQSMTQSSRRSAQRCIKQIDSALRRIEHNEYGLCLECEEEINQARLQARPESALCLECQSKREKR
jgi:DnaK suppressor protein